MEFDVHSMKQKSVQAIGFNQDYETMRVWYSDRSIADFPSVTKVSFEKYKQSKSMTKTIAECGLVPEMELWPSK